MKLEAPLNPKFTYEGASLAVYAVPLSGIVKKRKTEG